MANRKKPAVTPFVRLLGPVPMPPVAANADYRDRADDLGEAVIKAAKQNPARFFAVLAKKDPLLEDHDVVWALGYVKNPRAVVPLVAALGSKHAHIRRAAANGLCQHRHASAVDPLVKALRDRSPDVRQQVVEALGQQRSVRAIPALREALTQPANQKHTCLLKTIREVIALLGGRKRTAS